MGLKNIVDIKNFNTQIMLAISLSFLALIGSLVYPIGWNFYWDYYSPETGTKAKFEEHLRQSEEAIDDFRKGLKDILEGQEADRKERQEDKMRALTLRGLGVAGSFGGAERYVRVNADSDANIYRDGDRVRITKLVGDGRPSEIFEIRGEWTHSDSDVLVSFSLAACKILEIEAITKVQLEPVLPK